ncbi:MAG: serine hydrolase [Planctomycetes bacterium]|nr:serine hydrolase [Planctomycetota bacterium]
MHRPAHLLFLLFAACTSAPVPIADRATDVQLAAEVRDIVRTLGPGVRAAVWSGPAGGQPTMAWNVETPMPCASAIKASYLVELFAARASALDAPLPGVAELFADSKHPALAHFTPAQRETARKALATASTRRIAEAMISGRGVDNLTYNIAANLVTAFCGGPLFLDRKLHARHPDWAGLAVRRYMLADRTANGDNEATARALAAVHGALAQRAVAGLSAATIDACRDVLASTADGQGRPVFRKGGALDSDPITRVEAGWREGPDGPVVFVVMLAQDGVAAGDRAATGQRLGAAARQIEARLARAQ